MWLIIIIMSLSLVGTGIIQLIWFKQSIDQDEKNFSDKVSIALGVVKEKIIEDAQKTDYVKEYYSLRNKNILDKRVMRQYEKILNSASSKWERQQRQWEINSNEMLRNPTAYLENIDKNKLDQYLKHELEQQGIELEYDYGVFSTASNSFTIINGNYVAEIGDNSQASNVQTGNGLYDSDYQISLFTNEVSVPGYLKIYFPDKNRWLWSSVMPSLLLTGLFTGLILFCFGFTIYVIRRQKMVSEMKTDFINNMTHEFKTPIATISLATDSINSPKILADENKIKRFTNIIKQENIRMLNQVEKVLQMAKLDKRDFEIKYTEVNIHEVIRKAAENVKLKLQKREGSITLDLNASDEIIYADKTHISAVINNLLDNAEKYSTDIPTIHVSTVSTGDNVGISITDNGIGMTKEQKKHIFEKFYRIPTGNLHNVKGFGLGLSYVKAIVDAHKGSITVKSELGKGSTFTIFLPQKARFE